MLPSSLRRAIRDTLFLRHPFSVARSFSDRSPSKGLQDVGGPCLFSAHDRNPAGDSAESVGSISWVGRPLLQATRTLPIVFAHHAEPTTRERPLRCFNIGTIV